MLKVKLPMPESCSECKFCKDGTWCFANDIMFGEEDNSWIYITRPNWCPLQDDTPVKPVYKDAGIFCGKCNSYIRTCDTFCSSCGRKIEWAENRRNGI